MFSRRPAPKVAIFLENFDLNSLRDALAAWVPFVFGIGVSRSFESLVVTHTRFVSLLVRGVTYVGVYAMMAVGYDDQSRMFLVRNSWSAKRGIEGYCWIPYDYLTSPDLTTDFLAIRAVMAK